MFHGKMKAVTFSFDDGVTQDKRLIEIFDKYGLKCTFNLNSELLGRPGQLPRLDYRGLPVSHNKVKPEDVKELYRNHEVAVHTLGHPNLIKVEDDAEVIRQVEQDRLNLSKLVGYEVVGMAYPCGPENNDDRVAELIKNNTGVKYARGFFSSHSFDIQDNLYRFKPTIHRGESIRHDVVKEFLETEATKPMLLYIWGHAYEFDVDDSWDEFEDFCKLISGHDDVFYGTNREIFGV